MRIVLFVISVCREQHLVKIIEGSDRRSGEKRVCECSSRSGRIFAAESRSASSQRLETLRARQKQKSVVQKRETEKERGCRRQRSVECRESAGAERAAAGRLRGSDHVSSGAELCWEEHSAPRSHGLHQTRLRTDHSLRTGTQTFIFCKLF